MDPKYNILKVLDYVLQGTVFCYNMVSYAGLSEHFAHEPTVLTQVSCMFGYFPMIEETRTTMLVSKSMWYLI